MDQNSEAPPQRQRRVLRYKLLLGAFAFLIIVAVAVVIYIRSGRLNRYITSQVQDALTQYGIRAEIGDFDIAWGVRTAKLRGVKLYNIQTGQLLATVDRAELVVQIKEPFALRLRREIVFKRLALSNLQAYVDIDEKRQTNLRGLHQAPPTANQRITFDVSGLLGSIDEGKLQFRDRAHQIDADIPGMRLTAQTLPGGSEVAVQLNTGAGQLNYLGRQTSVDSLELVARASQSGGVIERLNLHSSVAEATVAGRLDDWSALRYDLQVQFRCAFPEVAKVFAPDLVVGGSAEFDGRLNGEGSQYQLSGRLTADELTAAGIRLRGTSIENINLQPYDNRIRFSGALTSNEVARAGDVARDVRAKQVNLEFDQGRITINAGLTAAELVVPSAGARVRGVAVDGVKIVYEGASISFAGDGMRANSIAVKRAQVTGFRASSFSGTQRDGSTQVSVRQVNAGHATFTQGQVTGIAIQNIEARLTGAAYQVRGGLTVGSGAVSGVAFGPVRGQLLATNQEVALNHFDAALLGGKATGDADVRMAPGGASHLTASFEGLRTGEVFEIASVKGAPLAGTVDGRANLGWPGSDFRRLTGALSANLKGQTTQTSDAIPVTGTVAVRAQSGVFDVDRLELATDASTLTAEGRVSPKGDSDLRFSLHSTRAEQLQTIAYSIDDVGKTLAPYQPRLSGEFSFQGRVMGSLSDPGLEGDLNASSVGVRDQTLGSLTGHVLFSPQEVRFENAELAAVNGGSVKFTYAAPRARFATEGRLDAVIDNVDVAALTAAAGLKSQQTIATGRLSGQAHLTGLPGAPAGTAVLNLVDGTIGGQPTQVATANLVFDGKTARLNRAEIRTAEGQLVASGTLDLKQGDFQLQGHADNVGLGQLASSVGAGVNVTGTINANFQATGKTGDLGALNVQLTAQGKDVAVNGRPVGQLNLTAHTSPNGRIDAEFTTGISAQPQVVRASIELRLPGRPIEVRSDLTNFDLSPLIAAFYPNAASSVAGVVNGRLQLAGPIQNQQGQFATNGLRGSLTLNTISLQVRGRSINVQTPLIVAMNGPEVTLNQTRVTTQGMDLRLGGAVALSGGARLDLTLNGTANLDALGQFSPDYSIGGTVAVNARVGGTLSDPRLSGDIRLNNIAFSGVDLPANIEAGNGIIVLAGQTVTLESFTARANDGTVNANGTLTLASLRPSEWRFAMTANGVNAVYGGAQATVNANLTLTGNTDRQVLAGTVNIPEGEYNVNVTLDTLTTSTAGVDLSIGGGGTGGGFLGLPTLSLDVRVEAPNTFLIRNEQVNTVASARLSLTGTVDDPNITGRVTVEGGTIKFRSQRYEITTGTLDFSGIGTTPNVNFLAEGDVNGYHVYVGLLGPLDQMEVTLRSDPDLPRSEVLSLVATGTTESSILGSDDLLLSGLGSAASLLSDKFVSRPAQNLLGVSRFQLDPVLRPNSNPAARVTIGQQLSRGLSFIYSTNLSAEQDQTALLEYTLTNRFSGVAAYRQGGTIINGVSRDSDFTIEVRGRKRYSIGYAQVSASAVAGTTAVATPPRPPKPALPRAEVELNNPVGLKLKDKKLRELLPVKSQGFSRPFALLGERNLTTFLQEQGYFFAKVRYRCQPTDCSGTEVRLFYDVQPGQRYTLKGIRIEGAENIKEVDLGEGLQSIPAAFFGRVPFLKNLPLVGGYARGITSDDRIRRDRETIRTRLQDVGFRSARVESRIEQAPQPGDLELVFRAVPGTRTTLAELAFIGNLVLSSDELSKAVQIKQGAPFSPTLTRKSVQNIKSFYSDRGFLDAAATFRVVDVAPNRVRVVYDVNEGRRSVVGEIAIAGLTRTHENSVKRFLDFKPDDVLTSSLIRRTQRDLYATGAFSEVNVRTEPTSSGGEVNSRKVVVQLTEARPLLFVYGLGYSTSEGPSGLVQLTDSNLFGRVNSASIRMRMSRREQLVQLQYTDLRPFGTRWATTFLTFYDRNSNLKTIVQRRLVGGGTTSSKNEPGFGLNRLAAVLQTERKLSDFTSIRFRYNFEHTRLFNIQNIPIEAIARNGTAVRLGMLSAGLTHDTRDSGLNPTRGHLFSVDHSLAARPLGGSVAFNKLFGNYQYYRTLPMTTPLLRNSVLAFASRIGLAAPFGVRGSGPNGAIRNADTLLPISERFFSGGATTLRGFNFEQAGPQGILEPRNANELPTLVPLGGDALVVLNFELRYPLTRRLRLIPFYDVGNVFSRPGDISFGGMTHTLGIGFQINTPIGPVGVDYGRLLDPPAFTTATGIVLRQPSGVLHIRFGQTF
jgi:outer membrane protein assembly complex protein YaeT